MSDYGYMDFAVIYPGKQKYDPDQKIFVRSQNRIETGHNLVDLFSLIESAWEAGDEISIEISQHDPTPQYLYDNWGGEAPVTASEMHDAAFRQHQALHS